MMIDTYERRPIDELGAITTEIKVFFEQGERPATMRIPNIRLGGHPIVDSKPYRADSTWRGFSTLDTMSLVLTEDSVRAASVRGMILSASMLVLALTATLTSGWEIYQYFLMVIVAIASSSVGCAWLAMKQSSNRGNERVSQPLPLGGLRSLLGTFGVGILTWSFAQQGSNHSVVLFQALLGIAFIALAVQVHVIRLLIGARRG